MPIKRMYEKFRNPASSVILVYTVIAIAGVVIFAILWTRTSTNAERISRINADKDLRSLAIAASDFNNCQDANQRAFREQKKWNALSHLIKHQIPSKPGQPGYQFYKAHPIQREALELYIRSIVSVMRIPEPTTDCLRMKSIQSLTPRQKRELFGGGHSSRALLGKSKSSTQFSALSILEDPIVGGARCTPQPSGGVICRWPGKPWSVGITRYLVFVWKNGRVMFLRSNK